MRYFEYESVRCLLVMAFISAVAVQNQTLGQTPRSSGAQSWPQWRGPGGDGSAVDAKPPVSWNEAENIRWKILLPGRGSSSPIVWDDRVYVLACDAEGGVETTTENADAAAPLREYVCWALAFDRSSGQQVWKTRLDARQPHEPGHATNTFASASPVTDGSRLYASFGSRGIYALDLDGKLLWQRDLGQMTTRGQFGEGSSPAVAEGILVVPFDHEGPSFIAALDARTGKEIWRRQRDEPTTWATPLITRFERRYQVITNGTQRVRSYDLSTGELIWECGGQNTNPIPSPVRYEDNVIAMTGYRGYTIDSIPLSSRGDITNSKSITWSRHDAAPYVASPVLCQGKLYFVKSLTGILSAVDAETGEMFLPPTRLPEISTVYASPIAAAGQVYVTGRNGTTVVIKVAPQLEVVSINRLDDPIDASAAVVGDELYLRSKQFLYCIAGPELAEE